MIELFRVRCLGWRLLVLTLLLMPALESCRPFRIDNPQGPVVKKTKTKKKDPKAAEMADGSTGDTSSEPAKVQKNSYDKNGLLKKPKYKHRRLPKPGERFILGVRIPAWPWIHFDKRKKPKSTSKSDGKRKAKTKAAAPASDE